MSFHVLIPARLASTRLPGKVLRHIAGRPMIEYVCRAAQASSADSVIVATDSEEIADAVASTGARAVMTRADHDCGSDRIAEVVAGEQWSAQTIVVNVQADEPLMPPALIDQVGHALLQDREAAMATAATPLAGPEELTNANIVKVVGARDRALYFSRAPIPYHRDSGNTAHWQLARRHLGIYAYRVGALREFAAASPGLLEQHEKLEQLRAFDLGLPIALVEAVSLPGPGVDTEADLHEVEKRIIEHGQ